MEDKLKRLINRTKNQTLAEHVVEARGFFARAKGLLGNSSWSAQSVMWIDPCKSIHTFFMKFPIDVVFVDKQLKVRACYRDIKPNRMIWPVWSARSVFEFAAGTIYK